LCNTAVLLADQAADHGAQCLLPDALGFAGDQQRVPDALMWPLQQVGKEVQYMLGGGLGASMCAMNGGKCVESTMGFTALDGLAMGTRPGQLDPGVVLYLIAEKGMSYLTCRIFSTATVG
jgi:hypothetical protein